MVTVHCNLSCDHCTKMLDARVVATHCMYVCKYVCTYMPLKNYVRLHFPSTALTQWIVPTVQCVFVQDRKDPQYH